jgi:hypothetical protein
MLKFNEGKVCDAIIRHLEAREGCERRKLWSPEAAREGEPVELVFELKSMLFALEHTGIEPFEGHVQLNAEAERHFDPIIQAVSGHLPPEVIELHIPTQVMQGLKKSDVQKIQAALIEWICATAPTLPVKRYADYIGNVEPVAVSGVPFEVRMFRFENIVPPGRLQIVHVLGGDRAKARAERFARACDKKFPKLAWWKAEKGARSILVLEDNDIQLTNQATVAETFLPIAEARKDRPDETYLVASCVTPWIAWPILIDQKTYFDFARNGKSYWEIDQTQLSEVTLR